MDFAPSGGVLFDSSHRSSISTSLAQLKSSVERMDFTAVSLRGEIDGSRFDEPANTVRLICGGAVVNAHCDL